MSVNPYLDELKNVIKEFFDVNKVVDVEKLQSGHINNTYLITMPEAKYILQEINTNVFTSPYGMMHNIEEITNHIYKKIIYQGKDPRRNLLNIVKTVYGQILCIRDDRYWRCTLYIDDSIAYERYESCELLFEMGKVVGEFQTLLDGFHTRVLEDSIKNFHNTPYRFEVFLDALKIDRLNRKEKVKDEIDFINERSGGFSVIVDALADRIIPRRVTHNDTKPSNVLIDSRTKKGLCLIDLDTVMKGSLLYDYGDALRIGASTVNEDEKDLSKVKIDLDLFENFTKGFLKEAKDVITPEEVKMLYDGFHIITCEIAMRFLTDYINGDVYFKVAYPEHNLVRARNQMKIVSEIENKKVEIKEIIKKILVELEYPEKFLTW